MVGISNIAESLQRELALIIVAARKFLNISLGFA
jgi:hypothetical protein